MNDLNLVSAWRRASESMVSNKIISSSGPKVEEAAEVLTGRRPVLNL